MDDQLKLGEVDISKIELDYKSRDEIPQLLMGLRHIYVNRDHREKVFALLENAYGSKLMIRLNKINFQS